MMSARKHALHWLLALSLSGATLAGTLAYAQKGEFQACAPAGVLLGEAPVC